MTNNVVALTQELVQIQSVSHQSNVPICDFLEDWLKSAGFTIERLEYDDDQGVTKANLIARLGEGTGGLAFCSHCDTVPGQEQDWPAFEATVKDGRLYGRGSCDMKGPLAATMIAAAAADPAKLAHPVYVVITADEEVTMRGAKTVAAESVMLRDDRPKYGVVAEPTLLRPVYAHKGYARVFATAHGKAAHTSTGLGTSATFKIVPFMAEMVTLAEQLNRDPSYMNDEFSPPTSSLNMIVNDGNCALNVTPARTQVTIGFRVMPNSRGPELFEHIQNVAKKYDLEVGGLYSEPLHTATDSPLVEAACASTGIAPPETVPYGTDGTYLKDRIEQLVVLGPGDINVAHTVGESIPIDELERSVDIYRQLIDRLCLNGA